MGRTKLRKLNANLDDSLIIQPGKDTFEDVKHNRTNFFGNNNPIVLELACGKGEYTTGLAQHYPNKNFIGIDIKGNRLRFGAQKAKEFGLKNVAFVRSIIHHLDQFFAPSSIEEIWIIHPDPRPKNVDIHRRLTYSRFLDMYSKLLIPNGILRLKTDDLNLFEFSISMLQDNGWKILDQTIDLYNHPLNEEHKGIVTHYERLFSKKGRTICYLKAIFIA